MSVEDLKAHFVLLGRWFLLQPLAGHRTQLLVGAAFVLNIACYADLESTNLYKLLVQQALILCIGTIAAKLDRLRPK